jgi:hypothetical protein
MKVYEINMALLMTRHIVGICGKRRSGKDVVADHLCQHYGYTKYKIADKLKSMCKLLFGFTDEELEITKDEPCERWGDVTPRRVMQFMGTEVMQHQLQDLFPKVGRKFWIRSVINDFAHEHITISDLRFLHELEELKRLEQDTADVKVIVLKIQRNSTGTTSDADLHESETECSKIQPDVVIVNDGNLDDLLAKVDRFCRQLSET